MNTTTFTGYAAGSNAYGPCAGIMPGMPVYIGLPGMQYPKRKEWQ
jgi:hypothetical protein